jgi:hypothetical protein
MDLVLVRQQSGALVAFVPPVSIEDRPMLRTLVRLQTYYPEHILAYRSGKTCYSLIVGSGSFWIDCYDEFLGRRSMHHIETGPALLGAWSPSLDRDLDPLTGVERVGPSCVRGTSEACIFRGTQLDYIDLRIVIYT